MGRGRERERERRRCFPFDMGGGEWNLSIGI